MLLPFSGRPASGVEFRKEEIHDESVSLEITFPDGRTDNVRMSLVLDPHSVTDHGISLARKQAE
jgi:hypothetical protein